MVARQRSGLRTPEVAATCSAYDDRSGLYRYFRVSKPPRMAPYAGRLQHPLGSPVLEALPRLPRGAQQIGTGRQPIGTLVKLGGVGDVAGLVVPLVIVAGLAYLFSRGPSRQYYEEGR